MKEFLANYMGLSLDGIMFGLGILTVYMAAVLASALARSLGGAGSKGMSFIGKFAVGWFEYMRGDDRNTVNATLYAVVNGRLQFDTLIADRRIWMVWTNTYRVFLVKRASSQTTMLNPVLLMNGTHPKPTGFWHWALKRIAGDRVREDDYRAMYAPLISMISEQCAHDGALDLALGREMTEHRFVVALTFEHSSLNRTRRLRALVMHEDQLLGLTNTQFAGAMTEAELIRRRTLLSVARQYQLNPERFGIFKIWKPKHQDL